MKNANKSTKGVGFEKDLVRLPGQSVNESLSDFVQDKVQPDFVSFYFAFMVLVWVWVNEVIPLTYSPFLLSALSIVAMIIFGYRLSKARKRIKALRQGRDGEVFVGQILEEMRVDSNVVFHDVVAENFNIDHILIGPKGIYVIETKTWSKGSGKGSITYKDGVFKLNGQIPDKNPLDQAKANARWFSDFLKESTGKAFSVSPVVVLPGWFIEPDDSKRAKEDGVLLLNPKVLHTFVKNSNVNIADDDVHLAAYHTARYIKSK